jgi:predicted permease
VLLFTLVASVGSGVLFGLAPALRNPRAETLAAWRTVGGRHPLFRQVLVAAQISLSLILLAGAGLLLRTLWNLENQPLGMRSGGVVTASVSLSRNAYSDPARRLAFFEELEARLRKIPGVREAALANWAPPEGKLEAQMLYALLNVAGRPAVEKGTGGMVMWRSVTPRYFAALGIPILGGRGFQEEDRDPDRNVMILSDSLAHRLFPGEDPLGQQILVGKGAWRTVVGVAGNVKNNGLVEQDAPEFYEVRKHSPQEMWRSATAIVRSGIDARQVARWMRTEVAAIDPGLPVEIGMLDQQVSKLAARPRFNAVLLGIFAALGLALAGIGLYGLISFLVAQRTQEIGVRMALGATPGGIVRLVLRSAAGWTAAGAAVGTAGALLVTRLLESMLFGVTSKDPWTLAAAVSVLFGAVLAAAWIPARHAARVDPVEALRSE